MPVATLRSCETWGTRCPFCSARSAAPGSKGSPTYAGVGANHIRRSAWQGVPQPIRTLMSLQPCVSLLQIFLWACDAPASPDACAHCLRRPAVARDAQQKGMKAERGAETNCNTHRRLAALCFASLRYNNGARCGAVAGAAPAFRIRRDFETAQAKVGRGNGKADKEESHGSLHGWVNGAAL